MKKCIVCNKREGFWLGQQLDGPDSKLSYYRPGYHIRGHKTHPICDECWQTVHNLTANQIADIVNSR